MMAGARFAALCRPSGEGMPYPAVAAAQERLIIEALHVAWEALRVHLGCELAGLGEDQTTALLENQLNVLLDAEAVAGFSREFFAVVREPKVVNYDGTHPDKMPDLAFVLGRRQPGLCSDYALHAECKPVNSAIYMSPYCGSDGMGNFIRGDYACKMRSGFMIAYAGTGYTFATKVLPKLQETFESSDDPFATTRLVGNGQIPESHHQRRWRYANGKVPGDIRLLHIWLNV